MENNYQKAYDAQVDFFKVYDPLEEVEIEEAPSSLIASKKDEDKPTLNGQSYC